MGYTHEYSNFPTELYVLHNYKDADDSIGHLINTIKGYMKSGNYSQAKYYVEQNKEILAPYMINAETINGLEEEIRNLEIFARTRQQCVFYDDNEPEEVEFGDVWIGGE